MAKDKRSGSNANLQTIKAPRRRFRVNVGEPWDDLDVHDEGEKHETRFKVAGRVVTLVTGFAAVALIIILVKGDKETQAQILKLCDHIMTGALGACLGLVIGGGATRVR